MNAFRDECEAAVGEAEAGAAAAGSLAAWLDNEGVPHPADGVGCRLAAWLRRRLEGAGAAAWVTGPADARGGAHVTLVRKGLTSKVLARVPLPRALYDAAEADRLRHCHGRAA